MSILLIVLVVLLILGAVGGYPGTGFGYNSGTGYGATGGFGLIALLLILFLIFGHGNL